MMIRWAKQSVAAPAVRRSGIASPMIYFDGDAPITLNLKNLR